MLRVRVFLSMTQTTTIRERAAEDCCRIGFRGHRQAQSLPVPMLRRLMSSIMRCPGVEIGQG